MGKGEITNHEHLFMLPTQESNLGWHDAQLGAVRLGYLGDERYCSLVDAVHSKLEAHLLVLLWGILSVLACRDA